MHMSPNSRSQFQFISVRWQSAVCWFLSFVMLASCQLTYANGGMLIVSKDKGKTYLLFVQTHKHEYYEFPGGRQEEGASLLDNKRRLESVYETALRETVEEMRGYLGRQQLLSASSEKRVIEVDKFKLFVANVPFFQLNDVRAIKIPSGKKWSVMREVVNYAWVDVNSVEFGSNFLVTTLDGDVITMHPIAQEVVELGLSQQLF